MILSHHVEHAKAPIYNAMVPEQPSPSWCKTAAPTKWPCHNPSPVKVMPLATPLLKLLASPTHEPPRLIPSNLSTKACATHPLHCYSKQSVLGSWPVPHTWIHTQCNNYLMASPANAKGHMKQSHKGIQSTTPKPTKITHHPQVLPTPQMVNNATMPCVMYQGWGRLTCSPTPQSHSRDWGWLHCQCFLLWRICR